MSRKTMNLFPSILCVLCLSVGVAQAQKEVICIGDSITAGVGIRGLENKYTGQLDQLLGDDWKVTRFGVSGASMLKKGQKPFWDENLFQALLKKKPDAVVIFLGTNDTQKESWSHKAEFVDDYKAMIATVSGLASKPKIYLCLPVPIFKKDGLLSSETLTDEIIPMIRKIGEETKCPVIDLHKALEGNPEFFWDGAHPNAEGATVIAKAIHAALVGSEGK